MIPAPFDYVRPPDLDGALRILAEREGEAKLLSGGYSLLPLLKLRLASPALLVDLRDVAGLDGIGRTDDDFRIGSRATHRRIHEDEGLAKAWPIVHEAAGGIGDPQARTGGPSGGPCPHADPSSDWPAVLLAVRGSLVCRGGKGERIVAARDFFLDTFTTAIEPTEVLTEVRIPIPPARTGSAYRKLERRVGDFATVGAGVVLTLGEDGKISAAGVGLTAVAETPFAATDAEAALVGKEPTDDTFRAAGAAAAAQSRPATDSHGPAEYKRAMVAEMTLRALRAAADTARGQ